MVSRISFLFCLLFAVSFAGRLQAADSVLVLPLFNQNQDKSPNLDWIGESAAEDLRESLTSNRLFVLPREDREEVYRRMAIRPEAPLTRATVIKIAETLDATQVVFGDFHVDGAEYGATSIRSKLRLRLYVADLRRFKQSQAIEQTGPLENLSQLETQLSYMALKTLNPGLQTSSEDFQRGRPPVRTDAVESYIRGLLAVNPEQKQKLFSQAARLDEHFSQPNFQLGRMLFLKRDYKTAALWLAKVSKTDSHYLEAAYQLGICKYYGNDFDAAASQFQVVASEIPLNEVWNNLACALSRKGDTAGSLENFSKALEGDQSDPDYWFNMGYGMWKAGKYREAAEKFRAVLDRSPEDGEATTMLGRCIKMDPFRPGDSRVEGRERIKTAFEDSAFRQIEAQMKRK